MKTEYIVNKEKRTVVCIISDVKNNLLHDLSKLVRSNPQKYDTAVFSYLLNNDNLLLSKQYIGIAKCDSKDKFDESTGKVLAARRASVKYETDKRKKLSEAITQLYEDFLKIAYEKQVSKQEFECKRLLELEEDLDNG